MVRPGPERERAGLRDRGLRVVVVLLGVVVVLGVLGVGWAGVRAGRCLGGGEARLLDWRKRGGGGGVIKGWERGGLKEDVEYRCVIRPEN